MNGGTLNTTTTTAWSQREEAQCREKSCIKALHCPVGGLASVICKKTRFHFHLTSCLVRTGLWKPVKGIRETQSGSLSRVKGSGSVYSCQFSLVSRSPNEFLAQNLSERQIPDSSIIKLWRQITSVLTKTGGIRMGPSEGLCGRGRKKVAVIW